MYRVARCSAGSLRVLQCLLWLRDTGTGRSSNDGFMLGETAANHELPRNVMDVGSLPAACPKNGPAVRDCKS